MSFRSCAPHAARWLAAVFFFGTISGAAIAEETPKPPAVPVAPVDTRTIPPVGAQASERIRLPINKTYPIDMPAPVRDVIVSNPAIADIILKTPQKIYIVAKAVGGTNIFLIGRRGEVLNHLVIEVELDLESARLAMDSLLPGAGVALQSASGSIVLTGTVRTAKESADAAAIARRFVPEDVNVINMLRILQDPQVLLQVRVAEVQRNVLKALGISTEFNRLVRDRSLTFTTSQGTAVSGATTGSITFNKVGLADATFQILEKQGLVKTLAEPALTAISGETANFLAGGENPTPSGVDSQGNLIVQFRDFGVSLSFTPVVLASEQISLRVATEVSRRADENKLQLPFGTASRTVDVIGLSVRRASSTVMLPSGGSLMIAGLLMSEEFNDQDGVPGLKDLPVLGALFRSTNFQRNESELVVIVRAFLVRPVESEDRLTLPTDGFVPASDFDIYVLGNLHKRYAKGAPLTEVPILKGPYGYVME